MQAGAGEWLRAGGGAGRYRGARGCGWVRVLSKKNECIALACACVWEGYIQIFIGSASLVQLHQAGRVHASQDPINSELIVPQKGARDRRIFGHLWQDPQSCVTPSSDPSSGRSFHFPDASSGPQEGPKTAPTRPKTPTRRPEEVFFCARVPENTIKPVVFYTFLKCVTTRSRRIGDAPRRLQDPSRSLPKITPAKHPNSHGFRPPGLD